MMKKLTLFSLVSTVFFPEFSSPTYLKPQQKSSLAKTSGGSSAENPAEVSISMPGLSAAP